MGQPKLTLLTEELVGQILEEAFQLLLETGVKVQSPEARALLGAHGAEVNDADEIVSLPGRIIRQALERVPARFTLYNRQGQPAVFYGGDEVQFDPGSSGVHVLDPHTLQHRPSMASDLVKIIKVAEMLPQYAAQSTAVVCNDVPKEIGDLYRLYLVLLYSSKPVVTGAFNAANLQAMLDMLSIFAGGREALAARPQAVFDVCPSPPLIWSAFGAQNLMELARASVPAEIVSMPLAGAAAPVTLLGSVVQHAAECLSGIVIHQLAKPGAPIVWGGAPAIFDMRRGTTPMGAIETAMIDISYAQVGRFLGIPTHTYLGASDSKIVDAQAGMESGISAMLAGMAGINMVSGAGMLDFLACQSVEKLVLDAEAISMVQRFLSGVQVQTPTLALEFFVGINFKGEFLKQKATRNLFRKEQHLPSAVIDRDSLRGWQQAGGMDAFERAKIRVGELLAKYERSSMDGEMLASLNGMVSALARNAGMSSMPGTDE